MKIGFISDVHGNYEALKAVLGQLDKMNITEIYCLGDVVGYYSQVNECCDELRNRNIPSLMGNHDWYMAGGGFCPRSQSVNDCLAYQRKVITKENLDWVKTFQVHKQVMNIHMVHGGWTDPIDEYILDPTEEYFSKIDGEIFMSGHTHIQSLNRFGEKIYCNPGSVGMPRDNDPRSAFAVYDEELVLHRVQYDIEKVFYYMDKAGFSDYYYGGLKTGARNLRKL